MAIDKAITDLPVAEAIGSSDLFVIEQNNVAKSVSVDVLIDLIEDHSSGASITVDGELSSSSINPVQNKIVKAALDGKVDAESGKGLSTNDYTTAEKNKLAGIEAGANLIVVDTVLRSNSTNPVTNQALYSVLETKASVDSALPPGGDPGDILVKSSEDDYDVEWIAFPNANGVSF